MNNAEQGDTRTPTVEADIPQQKPWRRRWQVYAIVGWSSFLAASFATMVFFAFVDPADYAWMGDESVETTRMTGYALGFFFFWMVAAVTGFVVAYLTYSTRRDSRRNTARDRKSANG